MHADVYNGKFLKSDEIWKVSFSAPISSGILENINYEKNLLNN